MSDYNAGVAGETIIRLFTAKQREVTHLNAVLRKKNRKTAALRRECEERKRRIVGLLAAFDEVARATTRAEAQGIAAMVLRYDDREHWKSFRQEAAMETEQLDDTQNDVKDEAPATEQISDPPADEKTPPPPAPEGD